MLEQQTAQAMAVAVHELTHQRRQVRRVVDAKGRVSVKRSCDPVPAVSTPDGVRAPPSLRAPRLLRRTTNEVEFHGPGKETCGRLLALLVGLRALQPVKNLVAIVDAGTALVFAQQRHRVTERADDTTVRRCSSGCMRYSPVCAIRSDRSVSSRLAQESQCLRSNEVPLPTCEFKMQALRRAIARFVTSDAELPG